MYGQVFQHNRVTLQCQDMDKSSFKFCLLSYADKVKEHLLPFPNL